MPLDDPHLLVLKLLLSPHPLEQGLTSWFPSNEENVVKVVGWHFWVWVTKRLRLLSWPLSGASLPNPHFPLPSSVSLFLSLILLSPDVTSRENPGGLWRGPRDDKPCQWVDTEADLLSAANNLLSRIGGDSLAPVESWHDCCPANILIETWARGAQLNCT